MIRTSGKWTFWGVMVFVAAALSACSARQWYATGQNWQANECRKRPVVERERCMNSKAMSYEEYERETEAAKRAR